MLFLSMLKYPARHIRCYWVRY